MKRELNTNGLRRPFPWLTAVILVSLVAGSCQREVVEWETSAEKMVITDYVYNNPEQFTEFGNVLRVTGIENLLRVRGPFTLLLPTDDAMNAYYTKMGVSSYEQIDMETLKDLAYNHVLQGEVSSGSIGLGTLPFRNGLNDYVASDFQGTEILLNKTAIIIDRDITTANGYVHHIDHVLTPIVDDIITVLDSYPGFTIFREGLERTGIVDTLEIIQFPYGSAFARTRYTLLAVPDSVYNREGINSIDDLVDLYSTGSDLTDPYNGFYEYMDYHCLSGTYYFSDFEPDDNYYLLSANNYLNIKVEEDFKVNKSPEGFVRFEYALSNIPAKNGVIHTIDSTMPITASDPLTITHQTTDYFDMMQGPYYHNYYEKFYDGENTFEGIKWEAEFLQYYLKPNHALMDDDALNLNGHFWVEIDIPKIRAGTYTLSGFFFFGGNIILRVTLDGEYFSDINLADEVWAGPPLPFGEVTFTETKTHKLKLETVVPGNVFWDYIRFTPL